MKDIKLFEILFYGQGRVLKRRRYHNNIPYRTKVALVKRALSDAKFFKANSLAVCSDKKVCNVHI